MAEPEVGNGRRGTGGTLELDSRRGQQLLSDSLLFMPKQLAI